MSRTSGGIREYFLLSDAQATAKRLPEDARSDIARRLGLGRQRAEAADALWSNGHTAEGLRLAADAFESTLEAVRAFGSATGATSDARAASSAEPLPAALELEDDPVARSEEAEAGKEAEAEEEAAEQSAEQAEKAEAAAEAEAEEAAAEADEAEAEAEAEAEEVDGQPDVDAAEEKAEAATTEAEDARERAEEAAAEAAEAEEKVEEAERRPSAAPADALTDPLAGLLASRGLSSGKVDDVLSTERELRATALPVLDEEVSATYGELFQRLVTARRYVDRTVAPASMTPGQLMWTRISRIGFAALLVAVAGVGVYFLVRTPEGAEAQASARYNPEFTPDNVIDDDPATEWLLPNREPGWIEVTITPPRDIETVRLLNSHNRHYNDRATHEYTVELLRNNQVVQTTEGSFPRVSPSPEWVEHEIQGEDIEKIRLNVRSWHRMGGGLAEIAWE